MPHYVDCSCEFQAKWLTSDSLGDGALNGIAFENYVHNLALQHNKIDLKVLEYQPKPTRLLRPRRRRPLGRSLSSAMQPWSETCDRFRLSPAEPHTRVPLKVAYMPAWSAFVATKMNPAPRFLGVKES
ncbi:hypothetical protein DYB36_013971, partial [Aphanomyces astaci]